MVELSGKLKASTLVETLVAMSILSIVAALAISIFLAVSSPMSSSSKLMNAQQKSAEIMDTIGPLYLTMNSTDDFTLINLNYRVNVSDYSQSIKKVEVEVSDNEDRTLYTRRRLFYINEE